MAYQSQTVLATPQLSNLPSFKLAYQGERDTSHLLTTHQTHHVCATEPYNSVPYSQQRLILQTQDSVLQTQEGARQDDEEPMTEMANNVAIPPHQTAQPSSCADTEGTQIHFRGKAIRKTTMSYVSLISSAILSSKKKKLTLSQIYEAIQRQFPGFTATRTGWKNTVRHNLSLHECFVKGELASHGKSSFWRVHEDFLDNFRRGLFKRHRQPPQDSGAFINNASSTTLSANAFVEKNSKKEEKRKDLPAVEPLSYLHSSESAGWHASHQFRFKYGEFVDNKHENNALSTYYYSRVSNVCPCCSSNSSHRMKFQHGFNSTKLNFPIPRPPPFTNDCPYLPKSLYYHY